MLSLFYGGTFDPVHRAHVALARAAAVTLRAEVRLIPAANPPHRDQPSASAEHRARMLALAIADAPGLSVDQRELRRGGPSWSVLTALELREQLGEHAPLGMVLGADAFLQLPSWHLWRELIALAHLVVVARPGYALAALPEPLAQALEGHWSTQAEDLHRLPAGRVFVLDAGSHPQSSSLLRQRLRERGEWESMVPAAVAGYIRENHLYGC
ncbi:MAG: nicotinic acid mononucleotide adenylyltransferase [Lysobacterales bacterium CG17_big_fil_post_rev_8_21_14_2_50_64_11]|nr:MAG: nicotinic acid mononucleotide adenylyltransferase [Xanthomonadales bacterium CG17_big_fil_post_rev_8_21_14_2_50_64_11]PIX60607.1 MAG: nicotinic acid mononucleotide adenylyltransferase [Xanthomonadales bacterium CG_4_10_14_3_um_filter_64_11]